MRSPGGTVHEVSVLVAGLGVVGVVALVNVVAIWVSWRRGGHHPFRIPRERGPSSFSPTIKRRGSARIGLVHASWPLTTFEADPDWLRVSMPLRRVWIPRSRVVGVSCRGGVVRFRSVDGEFDGVTLLMAAGLARDLLATGWPAVR